MEGTKHMDYIMVTFQVGKQNIDLRVPVFVKIEELLGMLSEALQITISKDNRLQAEPLGRILDNNKTLEQEEVMLGSYLTLI
ncbi:MAG TPA: EsaB/YukD family protein [Clostridia bacterium]